MSWGRRAVVGLASIGLFAGGAFVAALWVDVDADSDASVAVETTTSSTTSSTTTTTTTTTTLPPPREATMAFTGDLLPHGPVVSAAAEHARAGNTEAGWDFRPMFDEVRPILSAADVAICHVESPVSVDDTNLGGYPRFNAPRALVEGAIDAGYDGCSTASNHSFDRGADGVRSTLQVFAELGIPQAGMAADAVADFEPVIYDVNGIQVGHISATYSLNGFELPADEPFLVDLIDPAAIIEEARLAKVAGAEFVVVSLHWGNEYQHTPSAAQDQWLAETLPSEEVDLIIGHHAHVVQPVDKVGDEWVVFGLGNFLSNQSVNCCVTASQDGMIATVSLLETAPGVIEAVGVAYTPTWVDRGNGYVIRVANPSTPVEGLTDTLAASAARTDEIVRSRLSNPDGLSVAQSP